MAIEFEIKMVLPIRMRSVRIERAIAAIDGVTCGPWSDHLQENTYFDSSDGAVRRARIALRHRRVDGRNIVTVKTAAPGGTRHEWEADFDGEDIPTALASLHIPEKLPPVEDVIAGRTRLVPIAGTDYVRRRCEISRGELRVEAAIDRGELKRGRLVRHFAELELELLAGSEEELRQLAEQVRRRLSLRYEMRGKLSRAMSLGTKKKKSLLEDK